MIAYIHIGLPKTGSSTIQRMLFENRDLLSDRGTQVVWQPGSLLDIANGRSRYVPIDSRHDKILFSEERLSNHISHPIKIRRIINYLSRFSKRIVVICYVRRSDEVFLSSYLNLLISKGSKRKLSDFELKPFLYPYRLIQNWARVVGQDNMIVRRFGDKYLPDGLVRDFFENCQIDESQLVKTASANVSPRMDVLELVRRINSIRPDWQDGRLRYKKLIQVDGIGPPVGMSKMNRMEIWRHSIEDELALANKYFNSNILFDHDFADDDPGLFIFNTDRIVEIIRDLGIIEGIKFPERAVSNISEGVHWAYESLLKLRL